MNGIIPFEIPGFEIHAVWQEEREISIGAQSLASSASCPYCQQLSARGHSTYVRRPADLPISGARLRLVLQVHRFFCDNEACPHQTFAEPLPALVARYARRTHRLSDHLYQLVCVVGGAIGALLGRVLGLPTSASTLLRIIRSRVLADADTPHVLGVDDWAFKKGQLYGTILVDLETHQVIDLLPDREADTLAVWLKAHSGVEIISRDRASEYATGASKGAPDAIQVADRWHLLKNLGDALQTLLNSHAELLRDTARKIDVENQAIILTEAEKETIVVPIEAESSPAPLSASQLRFDEVKRLLAQGFSHHEIARRVAIDRRTIARYARHETLPERQRARHQISTVTPYMPYILQRWAEGQREGKQLWLEIREQGFAGSIGSMYRALKPLTGGNLRQVKQLVTTPATRVCSARQAMWLLIHDPDKLTAEQIRYRDLLCERAPDIQQARDLALQFKALMMDRQADQLDKWLLAARQSGLTPLVNFAASLRRDYVAVKAAFTLGYSNGQVEGQINRLKLIKRQMYGRAKFDLLRHRVLARTPSFHEK